MLHCENRERIMISILSTEIVILMPESCSSTGKLSNFRFTALTLAWRDGKTIKREGMNGQSDISHTSSSSVQYDESTANLSSVPINLQHMNAHYISVCIKQAAGMDFKTGEECKPLTRDPQA